MDTALVLIGMVLIFLALVGFIQIFFGRAITAPAKDYRTTNGDSGGGWGAGDGGYVGTANVADCNEFDGGSHGGGEGDCGGGDGGH